MDAKTYLVFGGFLAAIASSSNGYLLEQTGYCINILEDDVGPTVDVLMNLCNESPPESFFAVYSVSGSDTKAFNFTKTDKKSCDNIFNVKVTLTRPISSEEVKKNMLKCVPFLDDPSMFNINKRILIYMVSKKTNVQLTNMNFNTFVLVTDELTNPDLWKDIATDREHVISVKERDKLLKLLERDTRFGKCPLDKFYSDYIGFCQDCSNELDSLPEECYYYGQRMKPPIPETTSPTPDYTTSPTPDYTWILYCFFALLLILIVSITSYLLNKRRKSRNELKKNRDPNPDPEKPPEKVGIQEENRGTSGDPDGDQETSVLLPVLHEPDRDSGHHSSPNGTSGDPDGDQETSVLLPVLHEPDRDSGHHSSPNGSQPSIGTVRSDSGNESEGPNVVVSAATPDGEREDQPGHSAVPLQPLTIDLDKAFKQDPFFSGPFNDVRSVSSQLRAIV